MTENRKIVLKSRPNGEPKNSDFSILNEKIIPPEENEVLLKTIYLSLDPYMRGRMNEAKSYAKSVNIGEVMEGGTVCQIIESRDKNLNVGDFVLCKIGWQEYATISSKYLRKIDPNIAPISTALGILGMPGTTAYIGMMNYAKPKPNETLVVSAASGPVGATAGQIGKIFGCRVIGVVGSDEKAAYVKDKLGFDDCLNYKNLDFEKQLLDCCPKGIDIYWENVQGKTFDTVFPLLNDFSRIPVCGLISLYNLTEWPKGIDRLPMLFRQILTKRIMIKGFLVFDHADQENEAIEQISNWIKEKKIFYKEDIRYGFEEIIKSFIGLLNGKNFGKLLIKVNED